MANPYAIFKTDEKLETEGVILDYGSFRIKIARAGGANKAFGKQFTERFKPYKRQMDIGSMDDKVATSIMAELYADTIILDMDVLDETNSKPSEPVYVQGVLDPDGKVLPYEKSNVVAMLIELPELFRDVQEQSNLVSLFRIETKETEIKN